MIVVNVVCGVQEILATKKLQARILDKFALCGTNATKP
jgi:hypothetical protein